MHLARMREMREEVGTWTEESTRTRNGKRAVLKQSFEMLGAGLRIDMSSRMYFRG